MLQKWVEILPLFVVKWLGKRLCEKIPFSNETHNFKMVVVRPDVYIRIEK